LELWEKVGNLAETGSPDQILFRDSSDYGNPRISVSHNWWVWKINQDQQQVGRLLGLNRDAEIGIIVRPADIVSRVISGRYDFFYPHFE
jgi:hypothetical protein